MHKLEGQLPGFTNGNGASTGSFDANLDPSQDTLESKGTIAGRKLIRQQQDAADVNTAPKTSELAYQELWALTKQMTRNTTQLGPVALSAEILHNIANNPNAGPSLPPPAETSFQLQNVPAIVERMGLGQPTGKDPQRSTAMTWEQLLVRISNNQFKHQLNQIGIEQTLHALHDKVQQRILRTEADMQVMRIRFEQLEAATALVQNIGKVQTDLLKNMPNRLYGTATEKSPIEDDTAVQAPHPEKYHAEKENLTAHVQEARKNKFESDRRARAEAAENDPGQPTTSEPHAELPNPNSTKSAYVSKSELETWSQKDQDNYKTSQGELKRILENDLVGQRSFYEIELQHLPANPTTVYDIALHQELTAKISELQSSKAAIAELIRPNPNAHKEVLNNHLQLIKPIKEQPTRIDVQNVESNTPSEQTRRYNREKDELAKAKTSKAFLEAQGLMPKQSIRPGYGHPVGQQMLDIAGTNQAMRQPTLDLLQQTMDSQQRAALCLTDLQEIAHANGLDNQLKNLLQAAKINAPGRFEQLLNELRDHEANPQGSSTSRDRTITQRLTTWFGPEASPEAIRDKLECAIHEVSTKTTTSQQTMTSRLINKLPGREEESYLERYIGSIPTIEAKKPQEKDALSFGAKAEEIASTYLPASGQNGQQPKSKAYYNNLQNNLKEHLDARPRPMPEDAPRFSANNNEPNAAPSPLTDAEKTHLDKLDLLLNGSKIASYQPISFKAFSGLHKLNELLLYSLNPSSLLGPISQKFEELDNIAGQGGADLAAANRQKAIAMIEDLLQDAQAMGQLLQRFVINIF